MPLPLQEQLGVSSKTVGPEFSKTEYLSFRVPILGLIVGSDAALSFLYDVSAMPITGGPYLAAAFLCEKVLREGDNVLSAVRIVDRWNINGTTETLTGPAVIQATMVIMFKSGIYRGNAQLTIVPISPQTNNRMQAIIIPVLFEGEDDKGVNIVAPLTFPVQEDGTYWFEVALAGQALPAHVVTAIPMRIAYLQIGPMTAPQNPANQQ